MALEYLRSLFETAKSMGMMESPIDIISDTQTLENAALRGDILKRQLAGPSPREKFESQKRESWFKHMVTLADKAYTDPAASDGFKDWVTGLFQTLPFSPAERSVLEGYRGAKFLSKEEQAMRTYRRNNILPKAPRDDKGNLLEMTDATEGIIAAYRFALERWKFGEQAVGYGVDKAKLNFQPSQYMLLRQNKDDGTPADLWTYDPRTKSVVSVGRGILGVDEKQLEKLGSSLYETIYTGARPLTKPISSNVGGIQTQFQLKQDLRTKKVSMEAIGKGPASDTEMDKSLAIASLVAATGDEKLIEGLTGNTKTLATILNSDRMKKFKHPNELPLMLEEINDLVSQIAPGWKAFIPYTFEEGKFKTDLEYSKSWLPWGGFEFEGSPVRFHRVVSKTYMTDAIGNTADVWQAKGRDGTYFVDDAGKVVPNSLNKSPEESLPDTEVVLPPPSLTLKTEKFKDPLDIFSALSKQVSSDISKVGGVWRDFISWLEGTREPVNKALEKIQPQKVMSFLTGVSSKIKEAKETLGEEYAETNRDMERSVNELMTQAKKLGPRTTEREMIRFLSNLDFLIIAITETHKDLYSFSQSIRPNVAKVNK